MFEEIDFQRAKVTLIRHRQVVYGLSPEQAEERRRTPVTAPLPSRPLESCAASAMLLAWLLVQKYANHLPLYQAGADPSSGMGCVCRDRRCAIGRSALPKRFCSQSSDCLMTKIRAGPIMQLDDTPVMCQGGRGEKPLPSVLVDLRESRR